MPERQVYLILSGQILRANCFGISHRKASESIILRLNVVNNIIRNIMHIYLHAYDTQDLCCVVFVVLLRIKIKELHYFL